jgi:hypothetical protein
VQRQLVYQYSRLCHAGQCNDLLLPVHSIVASW